MMLICIYKLKLFMIVRPYNFQILTWIRLQRESPDLRRGTLWLLTLSHKSTHFVQQHSSGEKISTSGGNRCTPNRTLKLFRFQHKDAAFVFKKTNWTYFWTRYRRRNGATDLHINAHRVNLETWYHAGHDNQRMKNVKWINYHIVKTNCENFQIWTVNSKTCLTKR